MASSFVDYAVVDNIATVALARPDTGNAYGTRMGAELAAALERADADPEVRVVILTGRGRNFCVGADLSSGGFGPSEDLSEGWREPAGVAALRIHDMNTPVIAAIRGAAVGAGSTIPLACDYRLAERGARFGFVFTRRGIAPEGASAWFLPRIVGMGVALDWMLSGRVFGAEEAFHRGLVHSVENDVDAAALELARELATVTSPVATGVTRRLVRYALTVDSPHDVQPIDSRLLAERARSADAAEGVAAFFDKRQPDFPGRVPRDLPSWVPWANSTG